MSIVAIYISGMVSFSFYYCPLFKGNPFLIDNFIKYLFIYFERKSLSSVFIDMLGLIYLEDTNIWLAFVFVPGQEGFWTLYLNLAP